MALLRRGHAAGGGVRAHADPWRAQQRRRQLPVLAASRSLRRTGDEDVHGFVEAEAGALAANVRLLASSAAAVRRGGASAAGGGLAWPPSARRPRWWTQLRGWAIRPRLLSATQTQPRGCPAIPRPVSARATNVRGWFCIPGPVSDPRPWTARHAPPPRTGPGPRVAGNARSAANAGAPASTVRGETSAANARSSGLHRSRRGGSAPARLGAVLAWTRPTRTGRSCRSSSSPPAGRGP